MIPQSVTSLLAEYVAQRPRTRSQSFFLSLDGRRSRSTASSRHGAKVRDRARPRSCAGCRGAARPLLAERRRRAREGRFHDLRHTHATELLRAGVHIKIVAERLGDRESTVMQTYSHVLPDMQETAAAAIEPMLRGLLPQRQAYGSRFFQRLLVKLTLPTHACAVAQSYTLTSRATSSGRAFHSSSCSSRARRTRPESSSSFTAANDWERVCANDSSAIPCPSGMSSHTRCARAQVLCGRGASSERPCRGSA